ncbi:unnamed protein product [Zymoseptoria tritici ST99CH_3D7]|uniref:Uncharacterized protein n=1 Tax=Zymoseptoria tritici (strain ST99CH_3D7) TaxID=1276538 RepID=A0A1X7RJ40_ZYMT9|nr:unnamed protein product [Zymoseptoria tritici ST99CH_3D7]
MRLTAFGALENSSVGVPAPHLSNTLDSSQLDLHNNNMSSTMAIGGFQPFPNEMYGLVFGALLKQVRAYHIKKEFDNGRRKTPRFGQWLVPVASDTLNVARASHETNALFYDEILRCATSSKKPTKMIAYIKNLNFRHLQDFIKNGLTTAQQQRLAESTEPKIIAILDFDGDEYKTKEFGQWIGFIQNSDVRVEYMAGDLGDPYAVRAELEGTFMRAFDDRRGMLEIYKACVVGLMNLRVARERVAALYEDIPEDETDDDDGEAEDRAAATRRAYEEMAKKMEASKVGKGTGLGALLGLDTTAGAEEDEVEDDDESMGEDSDSDPENMSSSDEDE